MKPLTSQGSILSSVHPLLDCAVGDTYSFMFCDLSAHPWRSSFLVHELKLTIASSKQDCKTVRKRECAITKTNKP